MDEAVTTGIISGIITGIILSIVAAGWKWYKTQTETQRFMIKLVLPETLIKPYLRFGVLHVSNENGTILNRVTRLKQKQGDNYIAVLHHPRNIGFQYKCFVDYDPPAISTNIISSLEKAGYKEPRIGKGKPNRIWFLLADKPIKQGEKTNNQYYPE